MKINTMDNRFVECAETMGAIIKRGKEYPNGYCYYVGNDMPEDVAKAFLIALVEFSTKSKYYSIEDMLYASYKLYISKQTHENPRAPIMNFIDWCLSKDFFTLASFFDIKIEED